MFRPTKRPYKRLLTEICFYGITLCCGALLGAAIFFSMLMRWPV